MGSQNLRVAGLVAVTAVIAIALAVLPAASARAQSTTTTVQQTTTGQIGEVPLSTEQGPLTGKERLGRKWSDEQRLDNCNVPVDKRGPRPRPSECVHAPAT